MSGEEGLEAPRRGRRYSLQLPVRFRTTGETEWHLGTTENVSYSGVAIRASAAPPPSAPVEIEIALPSAGLDSSGCLLGEGRVVRVAGQGVSAGALLFAVTVPEFRIEPLHRAFGPLAR